MSQTAARSLGRQGSSLNDRYPEGKVRGISPEKTRNERLKRMQEGRGRPHTESKRDLENAFVDGGVVIKKGIASDREKEKKGKR